MGTIIPLTKVLHDFKSYHQDCVDRNIKPNKFDFVACFYKYSDLFYYYAFKAYSTNVALRYLYEYAATLLFSPKYADKLTKSLVKSVARKVTKYAPSFDLFKRIMYTYNVRNASLVLACSTFECLTELYEIIYKTTTKSIGARVKRVLVFTSNMIITSALASVGYSIGYMISGPSALTTGLETAGTIVGLVLQGQNMNQL